MTQDVYAQLRVTAENVAAAKTIADALEGSGIEGRAPDHVAKLLLGAERGLSPMESITGFFIVRGKSIAMHVRTMHTILRRAGVEVTWKDCSAESATATLAWATSDGECCTHSETFTMEDARRAELAELDHWRRHPEQMLQNRALALAARKARPDLMAGLYEKEELESARAKRTPAQEKRSQGSEPTATTTTIAKAKRAEPQLPPAEIELWESWRTDLNQLGNDGHALTLRIDTRSMDEVRGLQERLFAWLKPNAVQLSDCSEGLKSMVFERLRKAAHGAAIDEADAVFVEVLRESLAEAAGLYPDRQVYRKGHRNRPIEDLRTAEEADAYARSLPKNCPAKHRKVAKDWLYHLTEEAAA